jgi:hypothetical protein
MSNSLIITKQTGNFFSLALNSDEVVISDQNRLTTVGNFCHFKTANGANIVKEQNVLFSDITLTTSGSATFPSVNALWVGLINAGFFDGLGTGGGGGGAAEFTELIDTFPSYLGRNGEALIINESQQRIESVPFYNVQNFVQLADAPSSLLPNKMITTNANGTALIMSEIPTIPDPYLASIGFFDYADLATQTTPLSFVTGVDKKLTNDGLGATTNKNYPPYGITDVWSTSTNACNFSQLSLGDAVGIRFDVTATTTSANQVVRAYIKLAIGTPSEYILNIFAQQIKTAQENQFTLFTKLYIGSEDIRTAPAEFYILSDNNGNVKVNGWYFQIERRSINVVTFDAIVPDTYKADIIYSGATITVPSGVKIRNVYLNQVPCYASDWSQSGNAITVTTALDGDKITLIN